LQGRDNPGCGGLDEVPIPETSSMSYKKIRRTLIPSHKSFAENLNRQENDKITRYPVDGKGGRNRKMKWKFSSGLHRKVRRSEEIDGPGNRPVLFAGPKKPACLMFRCSCRRNQP